MDTVYVRIRILKIECQILILHLWLQLIPLRNFIRILGSTVKARLSLLLIKVHGILLLITWDLLPKKLKLSKKIIKFFTVFLQNGLMKSFKKHLKKATLK